MPQLSLYVTQDQLLKIESEAHAENMSLSKWSDTIKCLTTMPISEKIWSL